MFFVFVPVTKSLSVGVTCGLGVALLGFTFVPWYHNLVVAAWSHSSPWLLAFGAVTGATVAVLQELSE